MPWYRCTIEGQGFPGSLIGKPGLVGFFVTRFVKAPSAEEAESLSLAELRREDRFRIPSAGLQPPDARVFFAEILEIEPSVVPPVTPGLVWYEMGC